MTFKLLKDFKCGKCGCVRFKDQNVSWIECSGCKLQYAKDCMQKYYVTGKLNSKEELK